MIKLIDETGHERYLGNRVPLKAASSDNWTVYGDVPQAPLIPPSQWDSLLANFNPMVPDHPDLPYVHDQDGIGQCFPKGTLVRMADGSQRSIEDVKVMDEVLTAEGNVKRVLRTMVREADGLLRVQTFGNRHLRCTKEHPILTKRGYVKAGELTREDWVAMPKYAPARVTMIHTEQYIERRVYTTRQATRGARVYSVAGRSAVVLTKHTVPDVIQLTREFGWLVGLYLAEGSTGHGKADWSLHVKETDTHAARLIEILKAMGADGVIRKVSGKSTNAIKVTVYGVEWAKLLESLCASGSAGKRLHPDLASGPLGFLEGVLEGWTDGDGLGDSRNGGVTVSHQLAVAMFDVANALGLRPTIETLDVKTYGSVVSRQKRYQIRWGQCPDRPNPRCQQDATHMWRQVDGVTREDFTGWVYNLEVADDHSYVAEGIGVHNCNADATSAAQEFTRAVMGLPPIKLCAGDLYDRINGGRDQGSLLEDAMATMMSEGIGTVETCGTDLWQRGMRTAPATERAMYKVTEAYLCPTFEHCFSAVLCGFAIISGIMWYNNFTTDAQGWLPLAGRGSPGGHAIFGYKPTKNASGVYGIWHQNSWTPSFGMGGRMVLGSPLYTGPVGGWWAIRQSTDSGGSLPVPKF